ncbi:MAG TPA: 2,3-epoxybenzoyl-CoA dihydrolase [Candidatus Polarisedimenticolaceae bacterium]|nr:2,3-epoxybenzoyl-CoA dihydrolase [Candidatus Polarisedimenticolaceae bacterium]
MDTAAGSQTTPIVFDTHPDRYAHWRLSVEGDLARLVMAVQEDHPLRPGYRLKLNSYDLGVDLELADAVERLRFEHPEVRCVVLTGALDRVFCAGANINMLQSASHGTKVNFCKFTNETRLAIEDTSRESGLRWLAALNGTCAGGGYELALACDRILLVDDGNSAVSLPEVPLLGVLPGTGGLTRLVDKRKVRRDLADVFCTTAEGIKGRRAQEWGLVDAVAPRSRFDEETQRMARELAAGSPARAEQGVVLPAVRPQVEGDTLTWQHVTLQIDREHRWATLTLRGPAPDGPADPAAIRAQGAAWWPLAAFRELDRALLHLRHNEDTIGLLLLKTEGDIDTVLAEDRLLEGFARDWFVQEVRLLIGRVLRRLDLTARSLYALVEPGSCFGGTLLELALAADRVYVLDDPDNPPELAITAMNGGAYPMSHGHGRLAVRFLGRPGHAEALLAEPRRYDPQDALEAGLVTVVADDVDYEVEVRQAMEQRVAQSPDALTGMEASLRFPGTENGDSKIFGRLTAWQNWIFQRPNAVGERGALTLYGKPERPSFDWRRT